MRCFYILPCSCDIFKSQTRIPVHTSSISVYSFAYIRKIFLTDKFTLQIFVKNRTAFPSPSQRVLKVCPIFYSLFFISYSSYFASTPYFFILRQSVVVLIPSSFAARFRFPWHLSRISDSSIPLWRPVNNRSGFTFDLFHFRIKLFK